MSSLCFFFQSGGDDEPMSDNDAMSREGDSPPVDALARVPAGDVDPETLDKLRRQASLGGGTSLVLHIKI